MVDGAMSSCGQVPPEPLLRAIASWQDRRAHAERIQRAVDMMTRLITDLLDLAKIEAGRLELQRRREQLHELIDEALVLFRPLAHAKQIEIIEPHMDPCSALIDRERMLQVLSNLIVNAVKFTPKGGRINVETRRTDGEQRVTISDTGPGISDEIRKHVFNRYWQSPGASQTSGSGLGLYIAKGIVEAHGGRIWVERAMSGGAQFTFAIPCFD